MSGRGAHGSQSNRWRLELARKGQKQNENAYGLLPLWKEKDEAYSTLLRSYTSCWHRSRIRRGATRGQIARILLAEYSLLGILGGLTGMILSILGAWAVVRYIFKTPFAPALFP
jgi:hypothetical protein